MSPPRNEILKSNPESASERTPSGADRLIKLAQKNPELVKPLVDKQLLSLSDRTMETLSSRENVLARMRRSDEPDFSMAA